ncbi:hypothetical protein I4U23_015951 [Adineta vaga]|nr:hypothetical protein I4U23_015951 [Adineta vaga]
MQRTSVTDSTSWLLQAIEQVTSPTQTAEDWSLIMKICDQVAIHEESAEEAIQVIKENLQLNLNNPEWRLIALTLTLLEALVKNCGYILHIQLANENFLRALKAIIAPKNDPPIYIEQQVLGMIQYWTFAFGDEPGFEIIRELYQECREQRFKFPPADRQDVIHTLLSTKVPAKHATALSRTRSQSSVKTMARPKTSMPSYRRNNSVDENVLPENTNTPPVIRHLPDEHIAKLRSELDLVHVNLDVFEEMIANLEPGQEHSEDWQLFTDLYKTCKKMQARLVSLLSIVAIDDIAVDFLRCNDRLNKAFSDYGWYMERRETRYQSSTPKLENVESNKKPISHPSGKKAIDEDDSDSNSNESEDRLKRDINRRKPLPLNHEPFSTTETGPSPRHLSERHSTVPTRQSETEEPIDQSILPTKFRNIRLDPLPDPVPRSTTQVKTSKTKRASSAAGSIKIVREQKNIQVSSGVRR